MAADPDQNPNKSKQNKAQIQTMTKYYGETEPRGRTLYPPWGAFLESLGAWIRVNEAGLNFSTWPFRRSAWTCEQAGPFGHAGERLWPCWVAPTWTVSKGRALLRVFQLPTSQDIGFTLCFNPQRLHILKSGVWSIKVHQANLIY